MKIFTLCTILALTLTLTALAQTSPSDQPANGEWRHLQLSTTTFTNGGTLPLSVVLGSNNCTYVSGGLDESPELSWTNVPPGTRSFVVTLYDVTASFTHWGIYNISPKTMKLPEDAGVAGSKYGLQVENDFGLGEQYDGPCPPNNVTPLVHDYVFTVFALDTKLQLVSSPPNFPANAETLYRAMFDHVIEKASVQGFFSTAN
jgi:Raf kinase inhibitor-like YbhB/YbcL family protein